LGIVEEEVFDEPFIRTWGFLKWLKRCLSEELLNAVLVYLTIQ